MQIMRWNFLPYSVRTGDGLISMIFSLFVFDAYESISMIFGCCYTYLSIKKNKVKEYKAENALTTSIVATLCGCWTIFLRRYVSTTPIEMQAFILLTTIAICCCIFTFYIGKIFIPMLYFIKKYNINEFNFTNEWVKISWTVYLIPCILTTCNYIRYVWYGIRWL